MRIISGNLKSRSLKYLRNSSTRPLKDNVRESIFNVLEHSNLIQANIKKSKILDLYSGIGSFGIESISNKLTDSETISKYGEGCYRVNFFTTSPGQVRGNPKNLDSYMFVTLSAYKKLKNTQKSFKIANSGFKRRIKASF